MTSVAMLLLCWSIINIPSIQSYVIVILFLIWLFEPCFENPAGQFVKLNYVIALSCVFHLSSSTFFRQSTMSSPLAQGTMLALNMTG